MNTSKIWASFAFALAFQFCSTLCVAQVSAQDSSLYRESIQAAMSPNKQKVCDTLVSINRLNDRLIRKTINGVEYILMVAWKQNVHYYLDTLTFDASETVTYNTQTRPIWVTTSPQLLQRMNHKRIKDVNLRLEQLLGLPPNSGYKYFIEFWVQPRDLFRPCPDNEIGDSKCELCFPENTNPQYQTWINEFRIDSYYSCTLFKKYPWTQLGYTYDWSDNNPSHIGLSEFVISEYANVIIKDYYKTKEYLKKKY